MAERGRVTLVTGAAGKGMGRSIAFALAREGMRTLAAWAWGWSLPWN